MAKISHVSRLKLSRFQADYVQFTRSRPDFLAELPVGEDGAEPIGPLPFLYVWLDTRRRVHQVVLGLHGPLPDGAGHVSFRE